MDYETQRKNMVESQVRPSDVTDRRIIRAMLDLPRERFVPEAYRSLAYMDAPVPLSAGEGARRTLLPARTLAKLIQIADIGTEADVLDIGVGTGYGAAVLGQIARRVVALESDADLLGVARRVLPEQGADNVTIVEGALAQGWSADSPYDAILVEGAVEEIGAELLDQLKDGGRLVAIVGASAAGRATLWRRSGSTFGQVSIFDAAADVLPGFAKERTFAF